VNYFVRISTVFNYAYMTALGEVEACAFNQANRPSLGIALLAYDTCLTMSNEAQYIWLGEFKLGTVLYILTRYPALLSLLLAVLEQLLNTTPLVCFFL
jgi:Family of unknown function (DUF6533)